VVWLPGEGILYTSDLLFQGRYPYVFDADIPVWIERLDTLLEFGASVIVPGHGVQCGAAEINTLRSYLHETWQRTAEHVRLGHSEDEAAADPSYPIFPGEKYERLHQANIKYMFTRLHRVMF
jgi:cyclase